MSNTMLDFLHSLKENNPAHGELIDAISNVYTLTSVQKTDFDHTFLRYPPGHYASPIPSVEEIQRVASRAFAHNDGFFPSIDLNIPKQIELYHDLSRFYAEFPYIGENLGAMKYAVQNLWFGLGDAFWLYSMMRNFMPKRIIEVGSGYSSCVMLDTNKYFLNHQVQLVFIEPYPENRLLNLLSEEDSDSCSVFKYFIQDVNIDLFSILEAGDILFVDSSHIGKIGSDVLHYFNTLLPALNKGVIIHFHDIPFPFEFTQEHYLTGGEPWNEMYFLRAFLQYNTAFEILLFPDYLAKVHSELLQQHTPLCCGGGSFWMRKIS